MNYVYERIIQDAEDALKKSSSQSHIEHMPLRGSIREDILKSILRPWMPAFTILGKGTIVESSSADILEGEDDIIVFDKYLCPPLRFDQETNIGIYPYNGVLGRIEVKSKLTKSDIRQLAKRSQKITSFKVDVRSNKAPKVEGAYNYLLAYDSKAKSKDEFERFREVCTELECEPDSGFVSLYCVLGKGIYKLGHEGDKIWVKSSESSAIEQLARFVAICAEMTLRSHIIRQGRSVEKSLEISIGNFFPNPGWSPA